MALEILITIAAGPTIRVATKTMSLTNARTGERYQYVGAIAVDEMPGVGDAGADSFECTIPWRVLTDGGTRADWLATGCSLGGSEAEVACIDSAAGTIESRTILMVGIVMPASERHHEERVEFTISASGQQYNASFPPHVLTDRSFGEAAIPQSSQGQAVAIPYGFCTEVPVLPLQDLVSPPSGALPTSARFVVTGCRIGSSRIKIKLNGDVTNYIYRDVVYGADPVGGTGQIGYVVIDRADAQGFGTFVAELEGRIGPGGQSISGLGDVLLDVARSFGAVSENRIDWRRMSRFLRYANAIRVSSVFAGSPTGWLSALQGRYGGFPIDLGWRNGRFGADWLAFDPTTPATRTLTYGEDLFDRPDGVETDGRDDLPCSAYRFLYDYDVVGQKTRRTLVIDETNDQRCKTAFGRFGRVPFGDVQVYDLADPDAMSALAAAHVDLHSVQRRKVRYVAPFDIFSQLPIHDRFDVTDGPLGWSEEPFRLEAIQPLRSGRCVVTFRSFRDARLV